MEGATANGVALLPAMPLIRRMTSSVAGKSLGRSHLP
jgi:hypothetical protein